MEQKIQRYNQIFWEFTKKYDTNDSNLLRKVIHSFDVAKTCFAISCHFGLKEEDKQLCYLMGLFHDMGRFEQWKRFQSYNDKKTVDHGDLSFDIIEKDYDYKRLNINSKDFEILKESVKYHTKPYLGKSKRVRMFNDIIKNADSFSNVVSTANGIQQMTVDKDGVSPDLLNDFIELKPLYIYSPETKLDRCLILTSCCYNVKFAFLREEIVRYKYIDAIYTTFSKYLNAKDNKTYREAIKGLKTKYRIEA